MYFELHDFLHLNASVLIPGYTAANNEMNLPSSSRRLDPTSYASRAPLTAEGEEPLPSLQNYNRNFTPSQKSRVQTPVSGAGCILANLTGRLGSDSSFLPHEETTHFHIFNNPSTSANQNQIIGRFGTCMESLVKTQGLPAGQEANILHQGGLDKKLASGSTAELIVDDFLLTLRNGFDSKTTLDNTKLESKKEVFSAPNLPVDDRSQDMSSTLRRPVQIWLGNDRKITSASQELAKRY